MKRHELNDTDVEEALDEQRRCEIAASYCPGLSNKELAAVHTLRSGVVRWLVVNGGVEEQFVFHREAVERYNELP